MPSQSMLRRSKVLLFMVSLIPLGQLLAWLFPIRMNPRRIGLVAILAVLLAGCSTVKLLYDRMDWLLPWYVGHYVDLTGDQQSLLDQRLAELLRWHRQTQLPQYARWLRELADDLVDGLEREELARHERTLERFWSESIQRLAPDMALLLAELSVDQREQLFEALAERNRRYQRRYVDPPLLRVVDRRTEQARERLEYWLGGITTEQTAIIRDWGRRYAPLGERNLAFRQHWQQRLRGLVDGHTTPVFESAFTGLLIEPEDARSATLTRVRVLTRELLLALDQSLSSRQRQHLLGRLTALAEDFEQLARNG